MSRIFQSSRGLNWEDLDDEDLKVFAPDKEETERNGQADVYNAEDESPIFCLSLARMKYDNAVWDTCHALPAHRELSQSESFYYSFERAQYHTNWRDLKVYYGADPKLPAPPQSTPPSSRASGDQHSHVTTVGSAFSDSSEDGICISDDASTSETEEDDICLKLDFAPSETQCIASTEKEQAPTSPICTATEGSHTAPTCLDIISSTEIADDISTSVADHESIDEGLVSDDDIQAAIILFSSPTEEAPVTTSSSLEALLTSKSADDNQTEQLTEEAIAVHKDSEPSIECTSPVPVTVKADIPRSTHLSTAQVKSTDYTPPAYCTEETPAAHGDSLPSLIETTGFSPDLALIQPPLTNSLVWDTICTAGFALSSVPWLRISVATAGIVVDIAATLFRR